MYVKLYLDANAHFINIYIMNRSWHIKIVTCKLSPSSSELKNAY